MLRGRGRELQHGTISGVWNGGFLPGYVLKPFWTLATIGLFLRSRSAKDGSRGFQSGGFKGSD